MYQVVKFENKKSIKSLLSRKDWDILFPNRAGLSGGVQKGKDFYNYDAFLAAASRFPNFLQEGTPEVQKRELAAFLANIAMETSAGWAEAPGGFYAWGLYFIEENNGQAADYIDDTKQDFPPVPSKKYFGRGPFQLSWNYNYGQFSQAWFKDKTRLLNNPELVSMDPEVAFASAIWFWMSPQPPKPSCHEVMVGLWHPSPADISDSRLPGFGTVLNIINGGQECGREVQDRRTLLRYNYYQYFCDYLHIPSDNNVSCKASVPFGKGV